MQKVLSLAAERLSPLCQVLILFPSSLIQLFTLDCSVPLCLPLLNPIFSAPCAQKHKTLPADVLGSAALDLYKIQTL